MKRRPTDIVSTCIAAVSALVLILGLNFSGSQDGTVHSATRAERILERRVAQMDGFVGKALACDPGTWMDLEGLPEDIVVYRYVGDTLKAWNNQFPVLNDNLASNVMFQLLVNPRRDMQSPLSKVEEEISFMELGPRWYLAKSRTEGDVTVIAGLEIRNRSLRVPENLTIRPLSYSGGTAVSVGGVPQFKILCESTAPSPDANSGLVLLSAAILMAAAMVYMAGRRSLKASACAALVTAGTLLSIYLWGMGGRSGLEMFSPSLYADGPLFYSLGAVLLTNLLILISIICLYVARHEVYRRIKTREQLIWSSYAGLMAIFLILVYAFFSLRSIIANSGISLELYRIGMLSAYSGVVYLSFITLLMSIVMLVQMLQPGISRMTGHHFDPFSARNRVVAAVLIASFIVVSAGVFGFQKERSRVDVWANRLAIDRDIILEMQLTRAEPQIAADMMISSLSFFDNTEASIANRIAEGYLARVQQDYDIAVMVFHNEMPAPLENAVPVADNSRFFYSQTGNGHSRYDGIFVYYSRDYGTSVVNLVIEPKVEGRTMGYAKILDISRPGRVSMPSRYSYARYVRDELTSFDGKYAYSTALVGNVRDAVHDSRGYFTEGKYVHFVNHLSDSEVVLISRPVVGAYSYFIAVALVAVFAFMFLSLVVIRRRTRNTVFERSYYKERITFVLMSSLILTLVVMAAASMVFVNRRNDENKHRIMTDKINSIQSIITGRIRGAKTTADLNNPDVANLLKVVEDNTFSDVTLYTPSGEVFMSTSPDVFDGTRLGRRMNEKAYEDIVYNKLRYSIQLEKVGKRRFYCMYAPMLGDNGEMIAIIASPYSTQSYNFEYDAFMHTMSILAVFLVLLLISRFTSKAVVDRLFKPLSAMSRRMSSTNLGSLEYISYEQDDEVATLVKAYNRMVTELTESTKQLAQAERDKAWSGMARQVAHEIKNPLTPMKLQVQRIMHLKEIDAPGWQDKFDGAAKVILDHIDILTETANEFSTFAKLYTEEPTRIDLDKLLQEEIQMFDNHDDVQFDYYGLAQATIMGPKPQLTRVFVNLLGNAVQALEGRTGGRVMISLRNGVEDGFYDVVVEDNGPGVAEKNIERLFTPNFTTKTGGSGLGLAISHSILDRCGASIRYSRSFTLGGACFTVSYPKDMQ